VISDHRMPAFPAAFLAETVERHPQVLRSRSLLHRRRYASTSDQTRSASTFSANRASVSCGQVCGMGVDRFCCRGRTAAAARLICASPVPSRSVAEAEDSLAGATRAHELGHRAYPFQCDRVLRYAGVPENALL